MNIFSDYKKKIFTCLNDLKKRKIIIFSDELKNLTVELPPKKQNADISCNAAMVLSKINKNSPIILAEILKEHLLKKFGEFNKIEIIMKSPEEWSGTVVALDSPNPEHCAPVPKTSNLIVIDHHTRIEEWTKEAEIIHQPNKTSTAEIIIQIINELGLDISKKCANVLLAVFF